MFGLQFDPTIDLGHFLTFITLVAGFLGAAYNVIRSARRKAEDNARSGALRLLLYILREKGTPMKLSELLREYESPHRKKQRIAYCGRDWHFKSMEVFEGAVYQLDWEGKIDFVSSNEIAFRLDRHEQATRRFQATQNDIQQMLSILRSAASNLEIGIWELEDIAKSCLRIAPQETSTIMREMLHSKDEIIQRRTASIIGNFVPDTIVSISSDQSKTAA